VKNEVLHRVKGGKNIRLRKANWDGHISRRSCLAQHLAEGKIAGKKKHGRRRKQLLAGPRISKILQFERGST
jgi:hypothetical protein